MSLDEKRSNEEQLKAALVSPAALARVGLSAAEKKKQINHNSAVTHIKRQRFTKGTFRLLAIGFSWNNRSTNGKSDSARQCSGNTKHSMATSTDKD